MTLPVSSVKFRVIVLFLPLAAFIFCSASNTLAQDSKRENSAPAQPTIAKLTSSATRQKGAAACVKTVHLRQVRDLAARLREFQAKQQAKNSQHSRKPVSANMLAIPAEPIR